MPALCMVGSVRAPPSAPYPEAVPGMLRQTQEEVLLGGLLAELRAAFAADKRGFTAQSDWPSGVLILNKGHFRGIWRCSDGQYSFTPGGYGVATYSAASAEEVVHYTLEHVCRDAREKSATM